MGFDKAKVVRAAEKYIAQGKIPAAIQEYRRIVEHDATDITALNTLGDLYSRVDKKDDAVVCFMRVASHYREQGFGLKAIAVYKKITRYNPGATDVAAALAALYEQQGLMVEARAQYMTVADAMARQGQSREALEILRRVADLDPNNIDLRLRLAESFLREEMNDLAAEAFTEAGDRLAAKGDYERALEAYTKSLTWHPHAHAALQGFVAAHTALGTADEAAEMLEQAVAARPADLELRLMLARALIDAENASAAEAAVQELVDREPSNFSLFFDVARLHLAQASIDEAVSVLSRIAEPAMSGREEDTLLDLLQEALARDPEQMEALRLLARIHTWQRDDDHLRVVLESIAEAAETLGLADEERSALAQLVRLSPNEPQYRERLIALGGEVEGEETMHEELGFETGEVPTFESFMLGDETFAASAPASSPNASQPASEFEWNTVEQSSVSSPPPSDANASFADLNDFTDSGGSAFESNASSGSEHAAAGFHDVDFSFVNDASLAGNSGTPTTSADDARRLSMLEQELESVDFYLTQGYTDIAGDTLDMLERQYGEHASIEARRRRITSGGAIDDDHVPFVTDDSANAEQAIGTVDFASVEDVDSVVVASEVEAVVIQEDVARPVSSSSATSSSASPVQEDDGLDPGLAAIFDEFREAVEESDPAQDGDYETHYNMGLAYKEMDLLDQAIEEFQIAAGKTAPGDGTPRYLRCCNLLGHCFMSKGVPRAAIIWFKKGLDAPNHTDDEYQALRFELGTAYEQMGDLERAIDTFTEVYGINVSYRGVSEKLRELQSQRAAK
ncbi:MAG TPA: tetratricopeptide repeat protein [Pyrinomonadaceae bacterium]|jgi:tetratricopeptide (TPR) repeat protein